MWLLVSTPSSRINAHLQKPSSVGLFLTCRKKNTHCNIQGIGEIVIDSLFIKGTYWAESAGTGIDTHIHHPQAHVSCLLSHMSEHASTQFGFVGPGYVPHRIHLGPLFPAKAWLWYWFQIWTGWDRNLFYNCTPGLGQWWYLYKHDDPLRTNKKLSGICIDWYQLMYVSSHWYVSINVCDQLQYHR